DVAGMFAELMPRVGWVVATEAGTQRAMAADELVALAHRFGRPAWAQPQVESALSLALHLAEQEQALLLITGSIFLVADAWRAWQTHAAHGIGALKQ
ncbi:MAG: hypothetical protein KA988_05180, partial [Longilinea sp.]|nr:hypothetical protein [Longilinea sp.]